MSASSTAFRVRFASLLAGAATLLWVGTAAADHIPLPEVNILVGPAGAPMQVTAAMLEANSASVVANPDGSVTFMNGMMMNPGVWQWTWDTLTLKEDPFVSFVSGLTNMSGGAMNFILSTSVVVAPPLGPSTLVGGSTSVTYTDANFDGLGGLSNIAGSPGYSGLIDGSSALDLLFPFSLTPLFGGDSQSLSTNAGLPGPTIPGPAAAASIGIRHQFTLSAGDIASFTSFFVVEPVPEPGTGALLAFGLLGLVYQRRRSRG